MERNYEFSVGQKVRTMDEDTGDMVYGVVTDKTRDKVIIKWADLSEPTEHERDEFYKIKIGL